MAHEYEEEEKKAKSAHPASTTAATSSKTTSSSSPSQIPAWTRENDPRVRGAERSVRKWLDENVEKLGSMSLTLPQLMQCVLDSVPAAVKLSRAQVETIICKWASDHDIPILQTVPPPSASSSTSAGDKGHKKKDK